MYMHFVICSCIVGIFTLIFISNSPNTHMYTITCRHFEVKDKDNENEGFKIFSVPDFVGAHWGCYDNQHKGVQVLDELCHFVCPRIQLR